MAKTTVKAVIKGDNSNARQPDNKEMVSAYSLITLHEGKLREAITVRVYMGRSNSASVVYACVWIHGPNKHISGRGQAGGYGYHKESQAIADAFSSAGVTFYGATYHREEDKVDFKKQIFFGGTGSSNYLALFTAAAKAAGYKGTKFMLVDN